MFMKHEWSKWQQSQNLAISLSPTFDPTPTQQNVQHSFNIPKHALHSSHSICVRQTSWTTLPFSSNRPKELLVGCGLTSYSAIFQLYSDGTVVQFSNLDIFFLLVIIFISDWKSTSSFDQYWMSWRQPLSNGTFSTNWCSYRGSSFSNWMKIGL